MCESYYDYGPVPFRFFHYWFDMEGFDKLVGESWKAALVADTNAKIKMMKKLKYLKEKICVWNKTNKEGTGNNIRKLKADFAELDVVIDKGEGDEDVDMNFLNILNSDQQADLECEVTKDEIKRAVWDCGIDKSPSLDGFTFGFHPRYWKIIESDVVDATHDANMVKDFRPISLIGSLYKIIAKLLANRLVVVLGSLVNEVQSAFVADRQILDGPFILNEIFQWCKSKKKQSLVFKVDFEKAYDSVRWDYLDDILRKFGFGDKWRVWIQNFLYSSRRSVIMNVMESLHVSFQRVMDACQWNESNINTIVHVLDCFHHASGLRINMSKSKILGIYVDADKLVQATRKIGCVTL
ncbi:RNA-directed DNA polymerase, eukaryota, reverse transcriptase zinc-binding domain protein [Tanacetum coccineum]